MGTLYEITLDTRRHDALPPFAYGEGFEIRNGYIYIYDEEDNLSWLFPEEFIVSVRKMEDDE